MTKKLLVAAFLFLTSAGTTAFAYYAIGTPSTPDAPQSSEVATAQPRLSLERVLPAALATFAQQSGNTETTVYAQEIASVVAPISETSDLQVISVEQPAPTLLLQGALGVPFTTFALRAGNEDVTVSEISIKLVGFGDKNIFESISLADDDSDFDDEKTFRSDRTAVFKDTRTIPAHSELTFTVYGNISEELTDYDGQMPVLSLQSVTATKPVYGSLPVLGASHTVNTSLRLGSATTLLSQFDPSVSKTQYINDTDVRFAGIRITAGTGENLMFEGITFEQTGTAGPLDITNVMIVADGISYPAEVDDREYSATFDSPIRIEKGRSIDVYIRGDITTTGSNRTLVFEIGAPDDIVLIGEQFGFQTGDIAAEGNTATSGGSVFITSDGTTDGDVGDPFFAGSEISISGGAFTSVGKN